MDVKSNSGDGAGDAIVPPGVNGSSVPARAAEHVDDVRQRILIAIERMTIPVAPPKAWAFLRAAKAVRRLQGEPAELLAALRGEFSDEQLLTACVLTQKAGDPPSLSPVLEDKTSGLIFLRAEDQSLINIMSRRGSLTDPTPEWRRLAHAYHDHMGIRAQSVLLAFRAAEMCLFQRLNLRFTPASDLRGLGSQAARQLCGQDYWLPQRRKFQLTLAGWQVAAAINQPSVPLLAMLRHLTDLQEKHGLDADSLFRVWLPSAQDFGKIRGALARRDRQLAATAMANSLAKSCYTPAEADDVLRERRACSYSLAQSALAHTVHKSRDFPLVAQAAIDLEKFQKVFEESLTDKFLRVESTADPWESFLSLQAGELGKDWFNRLELVCAARALTSGNHPGDACDNLLFQERLRIVDAYVKLFRLHAPIKKKGSA